MTQQLPAVTFQRLNPAQARELRDTVESIYVQSYTDAIASGDPFDSVEAFMRRFDSYASSATFDMIIAYADGSAVGQTWGWPLAEGARWWSGLLSEPEPDFTREDGTRTFALSEIMVGEHWAGRGIAHTLHDELLAGRHERRATLLVEPENTRARRAYLHWGWRLVAQLRPAWDNAPLFDVMTRSLPLTPNTE